MNKSIKIIFITLILGQGLCGQVFGDDGLVVQGDTGLTRSLHDLTNCEGGIPSSVNKAVSALNLANTAAAACPSSNPTSNTNAIAIASSGCGAMLDQNKSNAYSQLTNAVSNMSPPPLTTNPDNSKKITTCKAAINVVSAASKRGSTSSGMNAMQMMQMGQMGMQMLNSLASLAGKGGSGNTGGSSSDVTSAGATPENIGGSSVSTPATAAAGTPTPTMGASSAPASSAPFTASLGTDSNNPAAASPDSSLTAQSGSAPGASIGGSGALASSLEPSAATATGTGINASTNSLAALNAFNQEDGGAGTGGAMLGLKSSNDFQGVDPAVGKDGAMPALGAAMGEAAGDAGRALAGSESSPSVAQNDVHDPATSLFTLVSGKMREMKKRGSL